MAYSTIVAPLVSLISFVNLFDFMVTGSCSFVDASRPNGRGEDSEASRPRWILTIHVSCQVWRRARISGDSRIVRVFHDVGGRPTELATSREVDHGWLIGGSLQHHARVGYHAISYVYAVRRARSFASSTDWETGGEQLRAEQTYATGPEVAAAF